MSNRGSVAGVLLLRAALIAGIYVVALVCATINPMPGVSSDTFELIGRLTDVALWLGLFAPITAITGALLLRYGERRFSALDWISLVLGIVPVLLPLLLILAYSNCPNGLC